MCNVQYDVVSGQIILTNMMNQICTNIPKNSSHKKIEKSIGLRLYGKSILVEKKCVKGNYVEKSTGLIHTLILHS